MSGHLNSVSDDTNDMLLSNFHEAGLLPAPAPGLVLLRASAHCAPLKPSPEATAHCLMALEAESLGSSTGL